MMVHLDLLVPQEKCNALPNPIALERAWFNLARGPWPKMICCKDLKHFMIIILPWMRLMMGVSTLSGSCDGKVKVLEEERNQLSFVNKAKVTRIQELESELAKKGYELEVAEKESTDWVKERQDLLVRLGQNEVEKFDCICKLLPTMVSRLLQSHEYKKGLSEPFNMAIQAGWGKRLSHGQTDEQIFAALNEVQGFNSYSDMKLYPMYGKLFEAQYPFIAKISSGYHHSVTDLLKIHPDPAPSGSTPAPTISATLVGTGSPPSSSRKKA
ncbi:hypothetical protein Tco_1029981 [Tanacetum coccineum]|uniref:Uncharacterized protein n=1 Tax=Tanacetum coccineum TaxID=301880 RepID=A0ABQ5G6C7_9ASTR